jgi:hypothetical protein
MKYNEKMVLISDRFYQELMKNYNEEKTKDNEKIYSMQSSEEKKEEEEKKTIENEENFKKNNEEEEENEKIDKDINKIADLPLSPSDFFSNEMLLKKQQSKNLSRKRSSKKSSEWGKKDHQKNKKMKKINWIKLK